MLVQVGDSKLELGKIHADVDNDTYHNDSEGVSSSGLKILATKTPAHFWDKYLREDREPESQSPALILGSAIHTMTLEPEKFKDEYAFVPAEIEKLNRRTKEGKAKYAEWAASVEGKTILTRDQIEVAKAVATHIHAHPGAGKVLNGTVPEQSIWWKDEETGVICKIRPDALRLPGENGVPGICSDVKSTADAHPDEFPRSIYKFGYHISAAMYLEGLSCVLNEEMRHFVLIAAEKTSPYAVATYVLDDDALAAGRRQYRRALRLYAECAEKGYWPAYSPNIEAVSLPGYALKKSS